MYCVKVQCLTALVRSFCSSYPKGSFGEPARFERVQLYKDTYNCNEFIEFFVLRKLILLTPVRLFFIDTKLCLSD